MRLASPAYPSDWLDTAENSSRYTMDLAARSWLRSAHGWRIQPWSDELTELVAEGWGGSWGVYLTCSQPFAEVRKHLRRFLLVNLPDGRQVYFRYYDPRVLRTYLPTCTPAELTHFFGPIKRCFAESSDEDCVLEFASNHRDWKKQRLA